MRVYIKCNGDIGMPHKILQDLGIHSRFCHKGAVGVPAYMGSDGWKMHFVCAVIFSNGISEVSLPVGMAHNVAP